MEKNLKRLEEINVELIQLTRRIEELKAEKANIEDPPLVTITEFSKRHQNAFRRAGLKTISDLIRFLSGDKSVLSRNVSGAKGSRYDVATNPKERLMALSCIGEKYAEEMMVVIRELGLVQ